MRYRSFVIKNFRGIQELKLDLPPNPSIITLVGLNESGKTTILEAINYFRYNPESLEPLEIKGYGIKDPHSLIPISKKSNFNGTVSIEVRVELEDDDVEELRKHLRINLRIRDLEIGPKSFTITQVLSFVDSRYESTKNLWGLTLKGKSGSKRTAQKLATAEWQEAIQFLQKRLPPIIYFPTFSLELPDKIYLDNPPSEHRKHEFYRQIIQDILDSLGNRANVETHITKRLLSDSGFDKVPLDGILLDVSRQVTKSVFQAWNRIFNKKNNVKRVSIIGGVDDADGERRPYLQFRIEDADGFFFLQERSVGFRWFFSFLLLTQFRVFRQGSKNNALFLFDEPASNLHPTAQTRLLESLPVLLEAGTVIYTTHSHHLINVDWLGSTYVVKNEGASSTGDPLDDFGETNITAVPYSRFVHEHADQTFFFKPILDVLDFVPSRLESVEPAILVEGKSDFFALRLAKAGRKLNLMPGMGAGNLDTLIRLYAGWGRDFAVLLDSDAEGTKQKRRYEDVFESIVEGRLFTYADVDSSLAKTTIETLIDDADKEALRKRYFPDESRLTKKTLLNALQQASADSSDFRYSDVTEERLAKVIEFLLQKIDASGAG